MLEFTFHRQGGCLLKINGIYRGVKSAERRLADYILNNMEEVLGLTIEELAEKSGTSYCDHRTLLQETRVCRIQRAEGRSPK